MDRTGVALCDHPSRRRTAWPRGQRDATIWECARCAVVIAISSAGSNVPVDLGAMAASLIRALGGLMGARAVILVVFEVVAVELTRRLRRIRVVESTCPSTAGALPEGSGDSAARGMTRVGSVGRNRRSGVRLGRRCVSAQGAIGQQARAIDADEVCAPQTELTISTGARQPAQP